MLKHKIVVALPDSRYSCGQFAQPVLCSPNLSKKVEFIYSKDKEDLEKIIPEAEILVSLSVKKEIFSKARKLKWIHLGVAGVDKTLFPEILHSEVLLTSSKGIHRITISEHILGLILAFSKGIASSIRAQREKKWLQRELIDKRFTLEGKVMGIVGLGSIGLELAGKAKAFDMKIIGLKNQVRRGEKYRNVDLLLDKRRLPELLRQSDFVVLLVPLTKETYHLIGKKQLGLMKKEAYLIHVSRGPVVNERDLVWALKNEVIKGAGLDVVEKEPLGSDSPLYDLENVIITPHIAGSMPDYYKKVGEIFKRNLERFLSKKPLLNLVDKKKGY